MERATEYREKKERGRHVVLKIGLPTHAGFDMTKRQELMNINWELPLKSTT